MSSLVKPLVHELKTEYSAMELFSLFRYRSYSFFLDSSMVHPRLGRYSFFGFDPFLVFQSNKDNIVILEEDTRHRFVGSPVNVLQEFLSRYRIEPQPSLPPFLGGAMGYFSYDFGRQLEPIPEIAIHDFQVPDCLFGFYDVVFAFDHLEHKSWIMSSGFPEISPIAREKRAWKRLTQALEMVGSLHKNPDGKILSHPSEYFLHTDRIKSNFTKEQYMATIETARDYIAAGDIYQVNLSQRFSTRWENSPWDLYLRLRHFNPAPYSAYFNGSDFSILSSSPERFLRISQNHIETRPIKGTRPRGKNPSEDNQFRNELLESTKDRAELTMIIDLERNDIGKVCEFGTVRVDPFPELESYATVWHLVGTVHGDLKESATHLDCLTACFPGGSITGAPKIRAMQIIEELEPHRRGIYTGAIGYFGFNGETDFNIAIRTMILKNQNLYFHSGGGIVTDSDPAMEYEETLHKARALFQAIKEIPELHSVIPLSQK
jgi:para-aminobenzoate synthetase component I